MAPLNVEEQRVLFGIYACTHQSHAKVPLLAEHILYFARDQFSAFTERPLEEIPRKALQALSQGPGVKQSAEQLLRRLEEEKLLERDPEQSIMVGLTHRGVLVASSLGTTRGIVGQWMQDHVAAVVTGTAGILVTTGVALAVAA